MNWFFAGLLSHIFSGLSRAIDKVVLKKAVPHPLTNAFYFGLLGIFAFFLAPFGFSFPPDIVSLLWALGAGFILVYAFLGYFLALSLGEASVTLPIIGGWQSLITLMLSFQIFGQGIDAREVAGFFLLVAGTIIISLGNKNVNEPSFPRCIKFFSQKNGQAKNITIAMLAIGAATLFGISEVMSKVAYQRMGFVSGFLWIKIAALSAALTLLIPRDWRKHALQKTTARGGALYVSNRAFAGIASIIFNLAIALPMVNVALLDALGGIQLVVIFLFAFLASHFFPRILKERFDTRALVQKGGATVFIIIGALLIY